MVVLGCFIAKLWAFKNMSKNGFLGVYGRDTFYTKWTYPVIMVFLSVLIHWEVKKLIQNDSYGIVSVKISWKTGKKLTFWVSTDGTHLMTTKLMIVLSLVLVCVNFFPVFHKIVWHNTIQIISIQFSLIPINKYW